MICLVKNNPTRIQRVWLDIHLPSSFFLPRFCMEYQEGVGLRMSELVFRQGRLLNDFEQVASITIPSTTRFSFTDQGGNRIDLLITNLEKLMATQTLLNTRLVEALRIARPTIHFKPSKSAVFLRCWTIFQFFWPLFPSSER